MYQALYRKWRPRTFDEVVGQPHVTETLKKQLVTGRLSHAYLFIGTRGTGKTSCAKILAKAVNCKKPENGNPCNKCESCIGIDNGSVLDVVELDAASNNGVDNVRALRDEAVFTPATVKRRVYIIDEVHMLSISAFNALLKILEEPPSHLMFILATTESHKVPATILSRCQRYSFKRVNIMDIAGRIKTVSEAEGLSITDDAAELIARLADGSVRDALSILDQCTDKSPIDSEQVLSVAGMAGGLKTAELFGYILKNDIGTALRLLDELYYNGRDVGALLSELSSLIRDLLILKIAPKNGGSLLSGIYDNKMLEKLLQGTTADMLLFYMSTVNSTLSDMGKSSDRRLTAELSIITMSNTSASYMPRTPGTGRQNDHTLKRQSSVKQPELFSEPKSPEEAGEGDLPFSAGNTEKAKTYEEREKKDLEAGYEDEMGKVEADIKAESGASVVVSEDAGDVWNLVLDALRDKTDVGVYSVLSDSGQVTGRYSPGSLGLSFGNEFAKGIVTAKGIMDEIKKAAEEATGKTVLVRIDDGKNNSQSLSKLDKLSKFDNFSFK